MPIGLFGWDGAEEFDCNTSSAADEGADMKGALEEGHRLTVLVFFQLWHHLDEPHLTARVDREKEGVKLLVPAMIEGTGGDLSVSAMAERPKP